MNAKCPSCKIELLKVTVLDNGQKREVYTHPINPLKKCDYIQDGIKVETEITDLFMMNTFQRLVQESMELDNHSVVLTDSVKSEKIEDNNLSLIRRRLAEGTISASEFDRLKERLRE